MIRTLVRSAAVAALLFALPFALPAAAQTVQGTVTESQSTQPVVGARVSLLDAEESVVAFAITDAAGGFRVTAPNAGEYRLWTQRAGLRNTLTRAVPLTAGETVMVELRMAPQPAELTAAARELPRRQGISGQVLDDSTGLPVAGATVTLLTLRERAMNRAVTDSAGQFHLRVPEAAGFLLRAERVGFKASTAGPITVTPQDTARVALRVSATAVLLAPLTVVAASRQVVRDHQLAAFEWRSQRQPYGRYLGPEDVKRINPFYATDVLQQAPFVRVEGGHDRFVTLPSRVSRINAGTRCVPNFYVDGTPVRTRGGLSIDQFVRGGSIAAVEVYESPTQVPGEFPAVENPYCGVIVIWTQIVS
jgi:hypothetical protein